jgi:hypothetical protein
VRKDLYYGLLCVTFTLRSDCIMKEGSMTLGEV